MKTVDGRAIPIFTSTIDASISTILVLQMEILRFHYYLMPLNVYVNNKSSLNKSILRFMLLPVFQAVTASILMRVPCGERCPNILMISDP